eukprot:1633325-Rhodomonas_salina.4
MRGCFRQTPIITNTVAQGEPDASSRQKVACGRKLTVDKKGNIVLFVVPGVPSFFASAHTNTLGQLQAALNVNQGSSHLGPLAFHESLMRNKVQPTRTRKVIQCAPFDAVPICEQPIIIKSCQALFSNQRSPCARRKFNYTQGHADVCHDASQIVVRVCLAWLQFCDKIVR